MVKFARCDVCLRLRSVKKNLTKYECPHGGWYKCRAKTSCLNIAKENKKAAKEDVKW